MFYFRSFSCLCPALWCFCKYDLGDIIFLTSFHPETASLPFRGVARKKRGFSWLAKSMAYTNDFGSASLRCISARLSGRALTMTAVLAGADGWKAIKIFGDSKLDWLRQYRAFKNGIPTRHSIGRIIRGLSSEALLASFARWINEQREDTGKPHIAFDGKTLRGSGKRSGTEALHLMNAMVVDKLAPNYASTLALACCIMWLLMWVG